MEPDLERASLGAAVLPVMVAAAADQEASHALNLFGLHMILGM
jgi:hypothetical protein